MNVESAVQYIGYIPRMNAKLPLDTNYDLEQQFILRMTDTIAAQNLAADIDAGIPFKVC